MFTVVIPAYNHERFLAEAAASAMTEALVSEILIADDGSQDNSLEIVEKLCGLYPNKIRNLTQYPVRNIGAHAMLNRLISQARSEWIAVLNSDDKFAPGRFSVVRNRLRVSRFDFCFGNLSIIDDASLVIGRKRAFLDPQFPFPEDEEALPSDANGLLRRLCCQNYIATTSNMVFTKDLWARVGGFRDYRYVHDWDFAIRSMFCGEPVYIPEHMTFYRVHESNTIKEARDRQNREVQELFSALKTDFGEERFSGLGRYISANEYLRADA